tara:strand:+ start:2407 stop:2868 length:462 start_codon:yes stop_codon:yes gene_type:complete
MAKRRRRINLKAKGINAERELVHIFHKLGWSAVRIAGSGSSRYPCPDVLAGNGFRRIAIEAKLTSSKRKYFIPEDLDQLYAFSRTFGCEAWIAIKFPDTAWAFFNPEDLEETPTGFVASVELVELKGLSMEELLEITKLNETKEQNVSTALKI